MKKRKKKNASGGREGLSPSRTLPKGGEGARACALKRLSAFGEPVPASRSAADQFASQRP